MAASASNPSAKILLLMGAPGSGKGTQSSRLASYLRIPVLCTGEILRSEAKRKTPAGLRLRKILASGALAGDELVCAVVGSRLRGETPERGLILDGFPRTVNQAVFLDSLLADSGLPRPCVIHLYVSANALLERLALRRHCAKCGALYNLASKPSLLGSRCENDGAPLVRRDDDSESVILRRLAEFERSCAPLLEYYSGPDYHRIDGSRHPDQVFDDLLNIVVPEEVLVAS